VSFAVLAADARERLEKVTLWSRPDGCDEFRRGLWHVIDALV
jgi:hypothetical protein